MRTLIKKALRSLSVGSDKLRGAAWFKLGRLDRARRHFENALRIAGDDFLSHVYLGRIAYANGDYKGWRRECERAERRSPKRYARLRDSFELFEPRAAGTLFEDAGERASWRRVKVSQLGQAGQVGDSDSGGGPDQIGGERAHDDLSSPEEREKFLGSGPIRADEVAALDLDELLRRLSR